MFIEELVNTFKSAAPAPKIKDPEKIKHLYRHWRIRMMYSTFIGYAIFYFCRKNISIALPAMGADLHLSNAQLGILGSTLYISYGIGRFVNGIFGDKTNPKYFMTTGIILTAFMNIFFGLSSSLWTLAIFWGLNGWVQSMGFPPCAKTLANWYSISERATMWSIWHISHQLGAFLIAIIAGFLIQNYGWRSGFYVPAALCLLTAVFLYYRLGDTPSSVGLPNIATYHNDIELNKDGTTVDDKQESVRHILLNRVLNDWRIWLISIMTLFAYILRVGIFDWATKFLVEKKGSQIATAGILVSTLELVGILGPIVAGIVTDKVLGGKRAPWYLICYIFIIPGLIIFYYVPPGHAVLDGLCLSLLGFFVYGPQFLHGPFVADLASRKAASTANGLTGTFGYIGATLSGFGTGYFIDRFGWKGGFGFWIAAAIVGILLSLLLWNVKGKKNNNKIKSN